MDLVAAVTPHATGRAWTVPDPGRKKQRGPEGAGAWVSELIVARSPQAREIWRAKRDLLVRHSRGLPTPGARAGSANWAVAATVAWALAEPAEATPWSLLRDYARWCLGAPIPGARPGTLWSSETLSDIYGWTLHLLSHALLAAERAPPAVALEAGTELRRLLETHLWLLRRLTVEGNVRGRPVLGPRGASPRILYQNPLVWTAGERSPPFRHNGSLLSNWLGWIDGRAGTDREVNRRSEDRPEGWSSWPYRLCRVSPPRLTARDHGARLITALEVTRLGTDFSARLVRTANGNTAPSAAVSAIGGQLYVLEVGPRQHRVSPVETRRLEGAISALPPGEPTPVSIPAPPLARGETWHLGPGGFGAGPAV